MSDDWTLLREGMELLADTLRGGPARRLRSAGRFSPKLGGPDRLAALFPPVSPDPQESAAFRERHQAMMREQVLAAVTRVLDRWDDEHTLQAGQEDSRLDDDFVALANLHLLMRDRRGNQPVAAVAERLANFCQLLQFCLTAAWLDPLVMARLRESDAEPAGEEAS